MGATVERLREIQQEISAYLGLKHRPIGVAVSSERLNGPRPAQPTTFCAMVKAAMDAQGEIVAQIEDLTCPNAELCLGFRPPTYVDVEPRIRSRTKAVRIGPLEGADVVLFVLNPRQVMVMSILLGGIRAEFRGETAVCGEAVAVAYNEQRPNVTFLCPGSRDLAGFDDCDVVLALPFNTFLELPARMERYSSLRRDAHGAGQDRSGTGPQG